LHQQDQKKFNILLLGHQLISTTSRLGVTITSKRLKARSPSWVGTRPSQSIELPRTVDRRSSMRRHILSADLTMFACRGIRLRQCPGGSGTFDTFTTSLLASALSRPDSEVLGVKERPDDEQLRSFLLLAVPSCQCSGSYLPNLEYRGSDS
jgi:hypothetical protein